MTRRRVMVWLVGGGVTAVIALGTAALLTYRPAHLRSASNARSRPTSISTPRSESYRSAFSPAEDFGRRRRASRARSSGLAGLHHHRACVGRRRPALGHAPARWHRPCRRAAYRGPHGSAKDEIVSDAGKRSASASKIIIDHFVTHDAELTFAARDVKHRPLVFSIQSLEVDAVGFDRQMPFVATMTNPEPTGTIRTRGALVPGSRAILEPLLSQAVTRSATPISTPSTVSAVRRRRVNTPGASRRSPSQA